MVKQREFWTNTLMIASGLPRLSSRHHWVSGSTMASTPSGRAQTGICAVALVCMLRDSAGPGVAGLGRGRRSGDEQRGRTAASAKRVRSMITPVN